MPTRASAVLAALLLAALLLAAVPLAAGPDGREAAGLLPKDDLGVTAFQADHPECDGRGVLVAVLDTGVDLLHPALQKTPDGRPKIVDYQDATDAGRIDTRTERKRGDAPPIGLSGRRLTLGDAVPETFRIGLVRAGEIYPGRVLRRLRDERAREREKENRLAADRTAGGKAPAQPPDPGDPIHDLLLYREGEEWRVVVDTDADGDLAEEKALREYRVGQETAILGTGTRLGFGVRVERGGEAVSLLYDGGGHGTHVAGIIAGYYGPDSPLNGLAPGARILAVKIGNGRFGGPTTHLALMRGLEIAGRHGADVVNISFGGPSLFGDGREESARFIVDAVEKYGYAVCLSAGNSGPAHTTVGAPAVSRRAFSIGAWCSAATQISNYGVVEPKGDALFGFSSRGPLPSGGAGVDFIAPGAAVSTMPEWTLTAGTNMNGTSMAAPQASGAVAVLLSAALREKIPVTPNRLAAALRRGAKPVPGLTQVEQGYGLIQVGPSLDALREIAEAPEPVEWVVKADLPATRGTGYLETACVRDDPLKVELRLEPDFGSEVPAELRARFSKILRLLPDAEWLAVASPVHASSEGTTIRATADPARMKPGLNVAVIRAVDLWTGREEARAVVSVIRPKMVERCGVWVREKVALAPGQTHSLFFRVPPGATQVRVEARETAAEGDSQIAFRSLDVRPGERFATGTAGAGIGHGGVSVMHRGVSEDATLEVVLSRPFRTAPESSEVDAAFCFKGVTSPLADVVVPQGRYGTHVPLRAGGDVAGRAEAWVDWEAEPLPLAWKSEKDPDGPPLLGEETIFAHSGTAAFDVPAGKPELRLEFRYEAPFEDYLDDSVYYIRDQNGRIREKGLVRFGAASFKAPHRGRYELMIRTWERGRRFHREGRLFSVWRMERIRRQNLNVRHDIYEGIVPGGPSGRRYALPDGSLSSLLVERPKGNARTVGSLRLVDEDWGVALLDRRLVIEPLTPPTGFEGARAGLATWLRGELQYALDRDAPPAEDVRRILSWARSAEALGALGPSEQASVLLLRSRQGAEEAKAAMPELDALVDRVRAKGGENLQAALRARVEAALLAGDVEKAKADLGQVQGDAEGAHRARFLVARATGDAKAALLHLEKLLKTAPPTRSLLEAKLTLLLENQRAPEARRLVASWTEMFPGAEADVARLTPPVEQAEKAGK